MRRRQTNSTDKYWISGPLYDTLENFLEKQVSSMLEADPKVPGSLPMAQARARMAQEVLNVIRNYVPTEALPDGQHTQRSQDLDPGGSQPSGAAGGADQRQEDGAGVPEESGPEVEEPPWDTEPA